MAEQVDDLTLHHAYGNSHSNGVWSDGSTLYVADGLSDWPHHIDLETANSGDLRPYFIPFAPHIIPSATPYLEVDGEKTTHDGISALYAYDLETGSRRPLSDILHGVEPDDVYSGDGYTEEFSREGARLGPFGPTGVWSDGELLWLADESQVIKAYRLSSFRNRAEASGAAELAPGRAILLSRDHVARGLWSDRTTLWVVEGVSGELLAFNLADGRRMSQLDITGIEGDPWGIWSNGVTLWVSGWSDAYRPQVLAYELASGRRDPARDLHVQQFQGYRPGRGARSLVGRGADVGERRQVPGLGLLPQRRRQLPHRRRKAAPRPGDTPRRQPADPGRGTGTSFPLPKLIRAPSGPTALSSGGCISPYTSWKPTASAPAPTYRGT